MITTQNSPNNILIACTVKRKHFFKDRIYQLQLTNASLTLSDGLNAKSPKYYLSLTSGTVFHWLITNSNIVGFTLQYQGKLKSFYGKPSDMQYLKQKMGVLVTYDNIDKCYQIEKQYLQKGTFGKVLQGQCIQSQKIQAIKQLENNCSNSSLIKNEISILRSIANQQSPYILEVKEVYQDKHYFYIVTDFITGMNLHQHIMKRKTPFSDQESLLILEQLLKGVQQIHMTGVIHRDLKPANVMYDQNQVKIIDFGLSCFSGKQQEQFPTCGTVGYSAPEVFKATKKSCRYSYKVDLFSVGCIFYELITLKPLFPGDQDHSIQYQNENCITNINQQGQVFDLVKLFVKEDPKERLDVFQALKLVQKCIESKFYDVNTWYKTQFRNSLNLKEQEVQFLSNSSTFFKFS